MGGAASVLGIKCVNSIEPCACFSWGWASGFGVYRSPVADGRSLLAMLAGGWRDCAGF